MAEPTKDELVAAGVETDVAPPPAPATVFPRVKFEELGALPGEPKTDVKIRLDNGLELRERLVRRPRDGGFNFAISNALLDADGSVAKDPEGNHRIHPLPHEVFFSGEALSLLGSKEKVEEVLRDAREIAAAQAHAHFTGMDLGYELFSGRL